MKPVISVVIPAYGCAGSIADVLEALFVQTLPPLEIIVVNDCSPDNLCDVLTPYEKRIVHLKNDKNQGLSKTYNRGLRVARGEYVLTLHSDCVLAPDYIEKVFSILACSPTAGIVTGQYQFHAFQEMGLSDQLFSVLNRLPIETPKHTESVDEISFIEGKADIFRKADMERFGFFCENLSLTSEDQDLSATYRAAGFKLFQNHEARFSAKYNATQDSIWKVLRKQWSYARGQAYVLLKYGAHAVKSTTKNRNDRALHRMSQLAISGTEALLLAACFLWPQAVFLLGATLILRSGYYFCIASPVRFPPRLWAVPCGILADHFYTYGMIEGMFFYYTTRKV